MTEEIVGALIRIARREATGADTTTLRNALIEVDRAERARVAQDPGSEEEHRVMNSYAGPDVTLSFAVDSLLRGDLGRFRADVPSSACVLLAGQALTPDDLTPLLPHLDWAHLGWVQRQSARAWAVLGALDRARAAADSMEDYQHLGHREIGDVLALSGDARAFFGHWKAYAASKDRDDMSTRKHRLVAAVARRSGWRAALALCDEKRIGPGFRPTALEGLPLIDLEAALEEIPPGSVSERDRLFLLVAAVVAESPDAPETDHPRLPSLLDEVIALDPSVKEQMQTRNYLLLNLWPAFGDQASIDRAYKAARGPQAKGDIGRRLARDIVPGNAPDA